ncbi:MAG: hypothetical protein D4Q79_00965 [Spirochaetia bacterium]|nr:MAG: hypothetical protein D4Q79_00965 [Spirochaetia bacterium]
MAKNQKAAVTLSMTLLVGGLIVELGIALAFISYYLAQGGFGLKLSEEAMAAARSGAQDAIMRIVRDANFNPSPNPYTLAIGNSSAQITICKDTCAGTGKTQIDSLGSVLNKRRQIRVIVSIDSQTGKTELESEKEISL